MIVDLHAYSNLSGGKPIEELVRTAGELGIDALCIADRERSAETANAIASGAFDFPIFVGVELTSRVGDLIVFPRQIDPALTREEWRELNALERPSLEDVAAWSTEHDAVILLAHPYDRDRPGAPRDRVFVLESIAGVEIGTNDSEASSNRVALEAIGRSALPAFGGSAQQKGRGDGQWLTLLAHPVKTQSDLVDALRAGDFWAVQVGGAPPRESRGGGRPGRDDHQRQPARDGKGDRNGNGSRGGKNDRRGRGGNRR